MWRLLVTENSIGFVRDNLRVQPWHTGAFLKKRGKWIPCTNNKWEERARELGVSKKLITQAKTVSCS